jgi:transglutaminase-like putative cysteine protease
MKKITLLLLLLMSFSAMSQKYELGKVTIAELEEKTHPLEPSAGAAILYSKGVSKMTYLDNAGFTLVTEVQMKIKIYNKEGYDWANKVITFYSTDSDREIVDIDNAATYNLVGGSIKKTKLKSEGEFTEKVNKLWKQKKIMMPDVKEGSIVEYEYTIRSPFATVLPEWRFQESIPVNHSEYTTRIPEFYEFKPNFRGYFTPKVTKTSTTASITSTSKERTGVYVSKTTFSTDKTDFKENVTVYSLDKLPSMQDESYVSNIDNYLASVEHELSITRYPNSPIKMYSNSWEDVANTIYKYDDFGPELKRTGYFETDVTALIAGVNSPAEKAALIFNYVKNRMNWNKFNGYSCDTGVKKAYTDKVGNTAEINLMLTSMLRFAGLNADPVLVSTRSNKIALFPARSAFNYVIAAVEINGKTLLMDATTKWAMPNILPVRAVNWNGRLIRKDGTSAEIPLTPQGLSREVVSMSATLDKEGKVTGKARDTYFDYNAFLFRENYNGLSQESYLEKLEKGYKGMEISNYKLSNDKDLSKPVVEDYDFTNNNVADIIGDKMYINPMLFLAKAENPFKQEKREYPIDFVFPHQDKYTIGINLPEGYVLESLPQPVSLTMEDNMGSFKYNLVANGNLIQVAVTMDINTATISPDYYDTLKSFYQKMLEKQNEKIVLKRL